MRLTRTVYESEGTIIHQNQPGTRSHSHPDQDPRFVERDPSRIPPKHDAQAPPETEKCAMPHDMHSGGLSGFNARSKLDFKSCYRSRYIEKQHLYTTQSSPDNPELS